MGWALRSWWPVRLLALTSIMALMVRIYLVEQGILYGRVHVLRIDGAIAFFAVLALAFGLARRPSTKTASSEVSAPDRWNIVTAATGLLVLIVSGVSLFSSTDQSGLPEASCQNTRTMKAPYVGLTSENAGNSRSGPGRTYPVNGRFSGNCSVGFADYCLGEPVVDATNSTAQQEWVNIRWLRLIKQPTGWRQDVARLISGENPTNQFMSDAYIAPATNNEGMDVAPEQVCGPQTPAGPTSLEPFTKSLYPQGRITFALSATSHNAANIGFAVYGPPDEGFRDGGVIIPLYDDSLPAAENPGRVSPDNEYRKKISWTYSDSLRAHLPSAHVGPANVLLMAIPCISANQADSVDKAAIARYDITPDDHPHEVELKSTDYNQETLHKLARAACQANG